MVLYTAFYTVLYNRDLENLKVNLKDIFVGFSSNNINITCNNLSLIFYNYHILMIFLKTTT